SCRAPTGPPSARPRGRPNEGVDVSRTKSYSLITCPFPTVRPHTRPLGRRRPPASFPATKAARLGILRNGNEDSPPPLPPNPTSLRRPGSPGGPGDRRPAAYLVATRNPVQTLRYGEFKRMLAADRVSSVKVGPSELTGELMPKGPG